MRDPRASLAAAVLALSLGVGSALASSAPSEGVPVQSYRVVRAYPHDPNAFTQGLLIEGGRLYESTGLHGRSSVREVRLETGEVLRRRDLPASVFGEGLAVWGDALVNLTWTSGVGFLFDRQTFAVRGQFRYAGEGWGLTSSDRELYLSDGTARIRRLDPKTLKEIGAITVTAAGVPVDQLNELEWVKGEILANVWQTDRIARIDPKTGKVKAWIDLTGLQRHGQPRPGADVLNGIAYDAKADRLFVTGKLWPNLFEIEVADPAR